MKNTSFWLEEKSPKQLFEAYFQSENPNASFWDIFSSYEPVPNIEEPANTSPKWLQQQETIIHKIIAKHFTNKQLNIEEIERIIEAIEIYALPYEEEDTEDLPEALKSTAQDIAKTYLLPLNLDKNTLYQFLDALQMQLENTNTKHIAKAQKETLKQLYQQQGYTPEQIEKILVFFDDNLDMNDKDENEDEDEETLNEINYPRYLLAYSNTFYGFNDAGNLAYDEQEQLALKKIQPV